MINFKTENEPKMKFFDFGAFQKIEKMLSQDKIRNIQKCRYLLGINFKTILKIYHKNIHLKN